MPANAPVATVLGDQPMDVAEPTGEVLDLEIVGELQRTLSAGMRRQLQIGFEALLPVRLGAIERAIQSGDSAELRRVAHQLRGTSVTLGASRLSKICRELEQEGGEPDRVVAERQLAGLTAAGAEACQALRDKLG
jgi:HPt (histidine-containing phosphotransfer) domain-containing protein